MKEWKLYKIDDVCNCIFSGGTPSTKNKDFWDGELKWLSSGETKNNFIYNTERKITKLGVEKSSTKLAKKESVVIATAGQGFTRGQTSFLMSDMYINQSIIALEASKFYLIPLYLYYNFKNRYSEFRQLSDGTSTRGSLSGKIIKGMDILLPSLDTQKKIVDILYMLDKKIELNKKINKNLEQQAEAIFQSSIGNAISTVNLGEIADVKGGKRLPKGINLIDIPNTHPYIRVRDLNNALFASLTPDYAYVDEETQKSISSYIVSTGDVLISIVGTIGLTAIVDSTLDKANLTENCVKITNLKHITPEYLVLYLRSQLGREAIAKGTVGAVQQKLPIKNIQAIPIPLLIEKDKNTLFCTLDSIFAEISSNVIQSAKLASLRDTLIPKLMSGELDVSNINL